MINNQIDNNNNNNNNTQTIINDCNNDTVITLESDFNNFCISDSSNSDSNNYNLVNNNNNNNNSNNNNNNNECNSICTINNNNNSNNNSNNNTHPLPHKNLHISILNNNNNFSNEDENIKIIENNNNNSNNSNNNINSNSNIIQYHPKNPIIEQTILDDFHRKSIRLIDTKLIKNKNPHKFQQQQILNQQQQQFYQQHQQQIFNQQQQKKSNSFYIDSHNLHKKKHEKNVESLCGPIILQNVVLYSFFLIVIGSAEGTSWAPDIRVANFVPYCVMCIVLLEFNRLHRKPLFRIIFPLYTSNIPFAYMCIFSREAHVLISLLFFASCLCIFLQSGIPDLRKHILIFCLIFMINYGCCILFMEWFYIDTTGRAAYRGRVLNPRIHWGEEATILVSMALLGCTFIVLERFIKSYAKCVAEQHYQIQCLEKEKEKLESEISLKKVDLDTPIEKIMDILRSMINTSESENDKRQLIKVIAVLGSNKLYDPDFNFETNTDDAEVYSWLQSMLNRDVSNAHNNENQYPINLCLPSPPLTPVFNKNVSKLNSSGMILRRINPEISVSNQEVQSLIGNNYLSWDFPVFRLCEMTNGNPLFFMSYFLFCRHKFFDKYNISMDVFKCFMRKIEEGYDSNNPYHNSTHATDVLQNLNYFIEKAIGRYLTEIEIFSMILAAIVHDFKHPGVNNHFQINSKSRLALKYNDRSILENYHLHQAFKIMNEKDSGILNSFSESLRKDIRETIISLVLSTDMANHFDLVGRFKSKISTGGSSSFVGCSKNDRLLLMQIAIKCADVSNPSKPWHLYTEWARRVMEEFYKQGDEERQRNMDISAFMDRNKPATTKCQVSFINLFVEPIYEVWSSVFPEFKLCHQNIILNRTRWEAENPILPINSTSNNSISLSQSFITIV